MGTGCSTRMGTGCSSIAGEMPPRCNAAAAFFLLARSGVGTSSTHDTESGLPPILTGGTKGI